MEAFLLIIGWAFCGAFLTWFTVLLWFILPDRFSEGMISKGGIQRIIGIILASVCLYGWYKLFSLISFSV